jgi:hypothetical protein
LKKVDCFSVLAAADALSYRPHAPQSFLSPPVIEAEFIAPAEWPASVSSGHVAIDAKP